MKNVMPLKSTMTVEEKKELAKDIAEMVNKAFEVARSSSIKVPETLKSKKAT